LTNGQSAGSKVDVAPAKTEHLAAPHACSGRQQERDVDGMVLDRGQEPLQLLPRPGLHLSFAALAQARRISGRGHVALHQSLTHRITQRLMQRGVDMAHGLGREARAVA
jgi:hypothetical protein